VRDLDAGLLNPIEVQRIIGGAQFAEVLAELERKKG
jgi:hypothetical protein